jgi:hypothetical protein
MIFHALSVRINLEINMRQVYSAAMMTHWMTSLTLHLWMNLSDGKTQLKTTKKSIRWMGGKITRLTPKSCLGTAFVLTSLA